MKKTNVFLVIGAVIAGVAIASKYQAKELPEAPDVPIEPMIIVTREEILAAIDFQTLDDYYNQISMLYQGYKISFEEYMTLYNSYFQRFYELWEEVS